MGQWVCATAIALASVWLAVQANGQTREAEQRAKEEAALTAPRHREQMDEEKIRYEADVPRVKKESRDRLYEEVRKREDNSV